MHYSDIYSGLNGETQRLLAENRGDEVDYEMYDDAGGSVGQEETDRDEDYEDLPEDLQGSVGFLFAFRDIMGSKYVLKLSVAAE
jgi:hypothetical protein